VFSDRQRLYILASLAALAVILLLAGTTGVLVWKGII
jgi:hypothetical protein